MNRQEINKIAKVRQFVKNTKWHAGTSARIEKFEADGMYLKMSGNSFVFYVPYFIDAEYIRVHKDGSKY